MCFSCQIQRQTISAEYPVKKMKNMKVKEGFKYNSTYETVFDLKFINRSGHGVEGLLIGIGVLDEEEYFSSMYTNMSDESGELKIVLSIPLHVDRIIISAAAGGKSQKFEFSKQHKITESISVEEIL